MLFLLKKAYKKIDIIFLYALDFINGIYFDITKVNNNKVLLTEVHGEEFNPNMHTIVRRGLFKE